MRGPGNKRDNRKIPLIAAKAYFCLFPPIHRRILAFRPVDPRIPRPQHCWVLSPENWCGAHTWGGREGQRLPSDGPAVSARLGAADRWASRAEMWCVHPNVRPVGSFVSTRVFHILATPPRARDKALSPSQLGGASDVRAHLVATRKPPERKLGHRAGMAARQARQSARNPQNMCSSRVQESACVAVHGSTSRPSRTSPKKRGGGSAGTRVGGGRAGVRTRCGRRCSPIRTTPTAAQRQPSKSPCTAGKRRFPR